MSSDSSQRESQVFVLEDDEGILRLERMALERAGYRVATASSAVEAQAVLMAVTPDLVVLDYSLASGATGLDFYRGMRQSGIDVPAILVTGFSDEGRAIEALRAGVRDVIPKVGAFLEYLPEAVGRVLDQVRASNALADAQAAARAKDRFLAILSHELRTPLTPVLTAVQILQTTDGIPESARDTLEVIRRNVEMEARLIDDLLDVTRISRGKLRLELSPTDVHEKLLNSIEIVQSEARAKRLLISTELSAELAVVSGDPTRLQQAFLNVLKNAVKFTPPGGTISVRTANPDRGHIEVEISDSGIGIAREAIGGIFNAFEQGGGEITRQFGGLGLGLNISKALVGAHGGTIAVSSRGTGHGATCTIALPVLNASAVASRPRVDSSPAAVVSAPSAPAAVELRLLLVEDHRDTANMMAKILRRAGYVVTTADSVASALRVAASGEFDAVVSDIGLPDGTGLDLMRQLRAQHQLKGIALSGFGMDEDIYRSRDAGFLEHLVKPVNMEQLEAALKRVIAEE